MSDVMELIRNEDGTFSAYDDTYDVVIHCETEEEQKKVIERLKDIKCGAKPTSCPAQLAKSLQEHAK